MKITENAVYFWTGKDFLSNFHYSPFTHKGINFKWSEQAVMWRKAKLFGAESIANKILNASTPKACKDLGRSREIPFVHSVWEDNKKQIYFEVLADKFSTPKMKSQLLSTENKLLVEASPYDKIWGCGLSEDDPKIENPDLWKGQNLLGYILMDVRSQI